MISLSHQTCLNITTEALYARILGNDKEKRVLLDNSDGRKILNTTEDDLRASFDLSIILCYIQGLNMIKKVSDANNLNLDLVSICEIWKNGSIIKSRQLDMLQSMVSDFELSSKFTALYNENIHALRRTVSAATLQGIPIPALSAAVNYIHTMCTNNGNGKKIQAMRDFFGSHLVRFIGDDKDVHVEWCD